MGLWSKITETLGLVETLDDDDEDMDGMYGEMNNSNSYSNNNSNFGGFAQQEAAPQPKIERPNPWDINPGKSYKSNTKITSYNTSDQIKMIVINPDNYDEAREICDYIKSGKPVVVNLENMQFETAQRVMDFLSGSCYSLNGNVQRVAKNIFIVAPNNIDVSADYKSQQSKTANLPWMTSSMSQGKTNTMDMRP